MGHEQVTYKFDEAKLKEGLGSEIKDMIMSDFVESHHREPNQLEIKHLEEMWVKQIEEFIQAKILTLKQALSILYDALPPFLTKEEWDQSKEVLDSLREKIETNSLNFDDIFEDPSETFQYALDLSDETLESWSKMANQFLQEKKYDQACVIFDGLAFLNCYRPHYWLGLGLSLKGLKQFKEALVAFDMARRLDAKPYLAAAETVACNLALHDYSEADTELNQLKSIIETCGDSKDDWLPIFDSLSQELKRQTLKEANL